MSFEVVCDCGRNVRGRREARHAFVPCPGCGRRLFVLPASPWASAPGPAPAKGRLRLWRGPLLAALVSLALLTAAFLLLWPRLSRDRPHPEGPGPGAAEARARFEKGRKALARGQLHEALEELNAAVALRGHLTPDEDRRLTQFQRQVDLLTRLSRASLAEMVREGQLARGKKDWEAAFKKSHAGKAVILDDMVGLDKAGGPPALRHYEVEAGDETALVALEDLALLRELPLQPPQRLVFGARLASCAREAEGKWVVRFEPDSAVLLTSPDAAAAALLPLDDDLREALRRQERWLGQVRGLRPAPP
jgi:hypothetical protein